MSRKLTYGQAFNEAVRQEMAANENVFCAGEDIGAFGGVFGTYAGLQAEFGERRVVDTPISEQAIIGLGVGSAVTGLRPIVDIMFMDFICVAFDQIVNQAAKLKYMFGGAATIPLTISTGGGGGLSAAAQHSQSLEALICHIPGLKVVHPSNPYDMKGLMTSCIREDNPTIMIKHKRLLGMQGEVPEEAYAIPLGQANILRAGSDVTVVGWGRMVNEALDAAERVAADGIEVEVIDPRTLQPLDTATIVESVRKTNRVIVVHEAVRFGGLGAEVAAQIQEEAFDYLDAPVGRIAAPFSPGAVLAGPRAALPAVDAPTSKRGSAPSLPAAEPDRVSGVGVSAVGIIVNPHAGKDIRRLTSASGQTSDAVKIGIMRRVAAGAIEMGVDRVILSTDTHHLAERAVAGLDGDIEFVDAPLTGSHFDTVAAAQAMWKSQVGAVVVLGGDGTCRDVATGWPDAPLIAISTGTNNVFPSTVDGTTAGVAAALVASGAVDGRHRRAAGQAGRAHRRRSDTSRGRPRPRARRGSTDRYRLRRRSSGQRPDDDPLGRRLHRQPGQHRRGEHRRPGPSRRPERAGRRAHQAGPGWTARARTARPRHVRHARCGVGRTARSVGVDRIAGRRRPRLRRRADHPGRGPMPRSPSRSSDPAPGSSTST